MSRTPPDAPLFRPRPPGATAALVLADSTVLWGKGIGAFGSAVGEVVFNTSMTGYQEVLTDPSYAGQLITFTFPHIGNVGTNTEDIETITPAARGVILRSDITEPSNWRSSRHFDGWLKSHCIVGLSGIDTRALTRRIRDSGAPHGVIAYPAPGNDGRLATPHVLADAAFDLAALAAQAGSWPGLTGMDLAGLVSCTQSHEWSETTWTLGKGYGQQTRPRYHVVAVDFGAKRNILRSLAAAGCRVTVVPAQSTADDVLRHRPDGVFLSNGPGDPAATGTYAVPMIAGVLAHGVPLFGICLGHQLLALTLGGKTVKMDTGHRGANHPVKDLDTGKVEITSQNHGFVVLEDSLPAGVRVTHRSLFDGSVEGLALEGRPVFSVQYHPEASPGPRDSAYLFERFIALMSGA